MNDTLLSNVSVRTLKSSDHLVNHEVKTFSHNANEKNRYTEKGMGKSKQEIT